MPKTILITGANGRIGTALVKHIDSHNSDYHLILADLAASEERGLILDVRDLAAVRSVFEEHDIDTLFIWLDLRLPKHLLNIYSYPILKALIMFSKAHLRTK